MSRDTVELHVIELRPCGQGIEGKSLSMHTLLVRSLPTSMEATYLTLPVLLGANTLARLGTNGSVSANPPLGRR